MFEFHRMLRSAVPQQAVDALRRALERLDPFVNLAYSQDGEDMILRRLFEGQPKGFYVDVGAHDPFRFSNTCYFHRRGWTGINIDPNPVAIDRFRRHRPSDVNICVGVSEAEESLFFYFFNEPALNTFDSALAAERARIPSYRLIETQACRFGASTICSANIFRKGRASIFCRSMPRVLISRSCDPATG